MISCYCLALRPSVFFFLFLVLLLQIDVSFNRKFAACHLKGKLAWTVHDRSCWVWVLARSSSTTRKKEKNREINIPSIPTPDTWFATNLLTTEIIPLDSKDQNLNFQESDSLKWLCENRSVFLKYSQQFFSFRVAQQQFVSFTIALAPDTWPLLSNPLRH